MYKNKKVAKKKASVRSSVTATQKRKRVRRKLDVKVYRSGVTAPEWKTVNSRPSVTHADGSLSIRANIAVDPSAARQSEVLVKISTETLIELFESHFRVNGLGQGDLVLLLRKTRKAVDSLLEAICDIKDANYMGVKYDLEEVPLDDDVFESPDKIQKLKEVRAFKWDKGKYGSVL